MMHVMIDNRPLFQGPSRFKDIYLLTAAPGAHAVIASVFEIRRGCWCDGASEDFELRNLYLLFR